MEFPILISWTSPFPTNGLLGGIQILIEHYVSKQWRPWSDVRSAASDLGLHCLHMSNKKEARLKSRNTIKLDLDHLHVSWSFYNYFADLFWRQLFIFFTLSRT